LNLRPLRPELQASASGRRDRACDPSSACVERQAPSHRLLYFHAVLHAPLILRFSDVHVRAGQGAPFWGRATSRATWGVGDGAVTSSSAGASYPAALAGSVQLGARRALHAFATPVERASLNNSPSLAVSCSPASCGFTMRAPCLVFSFSCSPRSRPKKAANVRRRQVSFGRDWSRRAIRPCIHPQLGLERFRRSPGTRPPGSRPSRLAGCGWRGRR
jgi:hypothetical protein